MIRVELILEDKGQWVKVFDPRDFTVHLDGDAAAGIGDPLRIDLTVGNQGPRVILRGQVIEGPGPDGTTVALGPEEREKVNYLNGFVRGGLLNLRERHRLPLRLEVTYGGVSGPCTSYTRDINEEGVFVVTEDPLPEESEIHLLVSFPGQEKQTSLVGVVTHTVVIEDEDVPGMGIVFSLDDASRTELTARVDELEKKFLRSELPEETLL